MAERPVPERPDPRRRELGAASSADPTAGAHGMTWTALALLVLMMLVCGYRLLDAWDSRQPPTGVEAQEATVLGLEELDRARPGARATEYASIVFELPDGTQQSALYELRWLGEAAKGDTVTVYERDGVWRTTSEKSVGGAVWWAAGLLVLLVMTFGWFRVRARARRGLPAL